MGADFRKRRVFGLPWWAWLPVLLFPVWGWGFMWLNSHQGSAYTFGPAKRKVEALILRFEKEHGRLPEDWGQISAAYPNDLTYDYWFRCENHPWDHRESERLDLVVLRRVVPSDWEGHEQYAFSPFGEVDFEHPIYVKR